LATYEFNENVLLEYKDSTHLLYIV